MQIRFWSRVRTRSASRFHAWPTAWLASAVALYLTAPFPAWADAGQVVHGSDTSTISSTGYGKPNQTRLWFNSYQGGWDALIPKNDGGSSASDHYIMKDVAGNQIFTSVELEDRNTGRPDVFWDDAHQLLYVLGSHGSDTAFWKVRYDAAADQYRIDPAANGVTVPGIAHGSPNRPAAVYLSPNGALWVAVLTSGGLEVQHSLNGGTTWLPQPIDLDPLAATGVATWVHFVSEGRTYVGLFASENAGSVGPTLCYFHFIDQNANPSNPENWVDDSSHIPPLPGTAVADDHVAAARDDRSNLYFVAKTQGGHASDPLIVLYRRTAGGAWSMYPVTMNKEVPEQTRPSLAIDGERNVLYVFTTDTNGGPGHYKHVPLDALDELLTAPFVTVFSSPGKLFNDLLSAREAATASSGIVVLANNITDQTMWWNEVVAPQGPPPPQDPPMPQDPPTPQDPPAPQDPPDSGEPQDVPQSVCNVVPGKWLASSEIKWSLENRGRTTATIKRILIEWPEGLRRLKDIKLQSRIYRTRVSPPLAILTRFTGRDTDRRIEPRRKKEIKIRFERLVHQIPGDVYLRVEFEEGCSVERRIVRRGPGRSDEADTGQD